jgi:hypothetical protein
VKYIDLLTYLWTESVAKIFGLWNKFSLSRFQEKTNNTTTLGIRKNL